MATMLDTKAIAGYTFGASREALTTAGDAVRRALSDPAQRAAVNRDLVALLSGEATQDAKDFACRQLWIAGDATTVPALAALLQHAQTADMARYALEKMECPEAGAALRAALATAPAEAKAGIINSLGMRRDEDAVKDLAKLLENPDEPLVVSALDALGRIATPQSVRRLEGAKIAAALETRRDHALLFAADQLAKDGKQAQAREIFKGLSIASRHEMIRASALRGLARLASDAAEGKAHEDAAERIAPKRKPK